MKTPSALLVLMMGAVAIALSATGDYHLLQAVPVGGEGVVGALCTVDSAGRRLYVTHNRQVEVVDVDSGTVVGKIDNTPGARAIAVVPELGRGFVNKGQAGATAIFDLKTLQTIGEVKTGAAPTQILYDPATKLVFTLNRRGYSLTAIDAKEGTVSGTIETLDSRPEYAVSDGKGRLFVSLWEKEAVLPIDSRKLTAGDPWKPGPCERPTSMAIDQQNGRLFVGCSNRMLVVLNANNGRLITKVPTSQGRGVATAFDPQSHLIYISNGEGTNSEGSVTIIRQDSPNKYSVLETMNIGAGARAMALDEKTHKIFVPIADQSTEMGRGGNDIRYLPNTFRVQVFGK